MTFNELEDNLNAWATQKGLIKKANRHAQALKVGEEVGELQGAILKNDRAEIIDGIGDSFVTLILLAHMEGLSPLSCLESAWNEIKDRTGKTVNGTFIKDS